MTEAPGNSFPRVVVDASLALKWVLDEQHSPEAQQLLAAWADEQVRVMAPSLLIYEAVNVLYQRVRRQQLTVASARAAFSALMESSLSFVGGDEADLASTAIDLAVGHGLPATYDAIYMALAARSGCSLWTADERMWNSVRNTVTWVHWVGETA